LFLRQKYVNGPGFLRGIANSEWNSGLIIPGRWNSIFGNNTLYRWLERGGIVLGGSTVAGLTGTGGYYLGNEIIDYYDNPDSEEYLGDIR